MRGVVMAREAFGRRRTILSSTTADATRAHTHLSRQPANTAIDAASPTPPAAHPSFASASQHSYRRSQPYTTSHAASPPNVSAYLSARVARRSSCAASTRAETRSVAIRRCASASSTKSRAASAGQALATRWYAVSASTLFTNSACASERAEISPACASNAVVG